MIPEEFKDMRPFEPEELPAAYDSLLADPMFRAVVGMVMPQIPAEALGPMMHGCKTILEFQYTFIRPLMEGVIKKCTAGLTQDFAQLELSKEKENYTYISNHRDIVLDSGLLDMVLFTQMGLNTAEIAIGDNLLIYPWIKTLVRLNRSFVVTRKGGIREMLQSSIRLSSYMHYVIGEKKAPVWIAQREGRSKDSTDHTQESLLKMFAMGGEGTPAERLIGLNLAPLAISYEYDPCDWLKALEFQLKRDNPDHKKSQEDDLANMKTGIFGYKGRVHYQAAECMNDFIAALPADMPKNDFYATIAAEIDRRIYSNYLLYPGNFVAVDLLQGGNTYADRYTAEERAAFEQYINGQLQKIQLPNKDEDYLRTKMLEMYANPALNQMSVVKG
ncbi:MAG: 1-acyl-sn-glycerol-3-phosphate acyltransferase [Bacteroidaceae bacterium]|nr:1-acyl-sn-glycerol-3-phosphate acyltransferase [Bacteroidaceae bacterium]